MFHVETTLEIRPVPAWRSRRPGMYARRCVPRSYLFFFSPIHRKYLTIRSVAGACEHGRSLRRFATALQRKFISFWTRDPTTSRLRPGAGGRDDCNQFPAHTYTAASLSPAGPTRRYIDTDVGPAHRRPPAENSGHDIMFVHDVIVTTPWRPARRASTGFHGIVTGRSVEGGAEWTRPTKIIKYELRYSCALEHRGCLF